MMEATSCFVPNNYLRLAIVIRIGAATREQEWILTVFSMASLGVSFLRPPRTHD